MARKQSAFLMRQKIALGAVGIIVLVVLGYLVSVVIRDSAPLGNFVAGEHYVLLEDPRRVRGDKIEVIEFFSYACVHCFNLDPLLTDWVESREDSVNFQRRPVVASDLWRRLASHYYTLESLNLLESHHYSFFVDVHNRKLDVSSVDALADWAADHDIQGYRETYSGSDVQRRVEAADRLSRSLQIASVPTLLVQGKYVVSAGRAVGPTRMLDVVDHLIELERAATSVNEETVRDQSR